MPDIFNAADHHAADHPAADQHRDLQPADEVEPSPEKKPHKHIDEYSDVMRYERPSLNPLDSFAPKPENILFDSLDKEEKVILLLRRHPATQIGWMVVAILLVLFPLVFTITPFLNFLPARFQSTLLIAWYFLIFGFVLEQFLTWFFNVFIITDERVIDVDFHSLIYKNISAAKIENIEDITAQTGGALRSIFDFGTVMIQTAGAVSQFEFEDVPQPAKVTRLLNELLLEEEREKLEGRVN